MTIALTRSNFRATAISNPTVSIATAEGSIRKALADLNTAVRASTIDLARNRRAELRRTVTEAILLERAVVFGITDLSALANPATTGNISTELMDTVRLRALGRVMNQLLGQAPTDAPNGWWIPAMSEIIAERPGLHMDARDALTARFAR